MKPSGSGWTTHISQLGQKSLERPLHFLTLFVAGKVIQGWKNLLKLSFSPIVRFLANASDIKDGPQVKSPSVIKPLHSSIRCGWLSQSTGRGESTSCVNSLSAQSARSERQGMSPHLFPLLFCPHRSSPLFSVSPSMNHHFPSRHSTLSNLKKTWWWELPGLTLRGRNRRRPFGLGPPGEVSILELCGWAETGWAALHGVALLVHTLNKRNDCQWRWKINSVLLRLF